MILQMELGAFLLGLTLENWLIKGSNFRAEFPYYFSIKVDDCLKSNSCPPSSHKYYISEEDSH